MTKPMLMTLHLSIATTHVQAPNSTKFPTMKHVALSSLRITGGRMYGGSIIYPAPIRCVFRNTFDGKANSYIAAARDESGSAGSYFKMVEIQFSLGAGDEVVVSATRAGYLQQDNDQCSDAADLMDAWSRANLIQTTQCAAPGQTCDGYGLVGIELSALSGEGNVYDLTTSAMPSKSEFAVSATTFVNTFCILVVLMLSDSVSCVRS